jgi:nitroreductase
MNVYEALRSRGSTRAFLDRPVARETLVRVLDAARWAPSGSNIQPWQVHALSGEPLRRLCADVRHAATTERDAHAWPYQYYPRHWRDPYLARRRACGWGLYGLLGIGRGDRAAAAAHELRNFEFFGAPAGLFFFVDADLELGSWFDYGMFVQSVMLAAREEGLATCPQAAWAPFHRVIRRHLALPDGAGTPTLICGLALGYADPEAPINTFRPAREPVEAFTRFHGFGDAT